MRTESAFNDQSGLDMTPRAWDSRGMHRCAPREEPSGDCGRPPCAGARRPPPTISIVAVLCVLLALCSLGSAIACAGREARDGAGGQSGDEGRKSQHGRTIWLGTGGVAPDLRSAPP